MVISKSKQFRNAKFIFILSAEMQGNDTKETLYISFKARRVSKFVPMYKPALLLLIDADVMSVKITGSLSSRHLQVSIYQGHQDIVENLPSKIVRNVTTSEQCESTCSS